MQVISLNMGVYEGIVLTSMDDAYCIFRSRKHPERGWLDSQSSSDSELAENFKEFLSEYLAETSARKGREIDLDDVNDLLLESLAQIFISNEGNIGTALAESLHSLFS